jgi:hypothetical protein
MKSASTLAILASLLAVSSLHAKWSRIPIMQEKPVNVAVKGPHSAATIDSSSGIGQVDNLLQSRGMSQRQPHCLLATVSLLSALASR